MPAPTRNVRPAPAKRPMLVVNAKALTRHSVGYCSGIQKEYTTKLAPPNPRKNVHSMNQPRAPVGRKKMEPKTSQRKISIKEKNSPNVVVRSNHFASKRV